MKLTFSNSTMDAIMQHCRMTETPVATFINKLVDAEAERIRTNMKKSNEGDKNDWDHSN